MAAPFSRLRREALSGVEIVDMRKLREVLPLGRRGWRMGLDVSVRYSDRTRVEDQKPSLRRSSVTNIWPLRFLTLGSSETFARQDFSAE